MTLLVFKLWMTIIVLLITFFFVFKEQNYQDSDIPKWVNVAITFGVYLFIFSTMSMTLTFIWNNI